MYAKIFAQIYDGTLCTKGPWQALVTFQQFLVLADPEGNVDMTAGAISRRTTIPLEIITKGIEELVKDDPESRTPTEDGKRLIPLCEGRPWGWKIVNYKHYRSLKREEERREYHRQYWHKRQERLNKKLNNSTELTKTQSTPPIEVDSRQETEEEKALSGLQANTDVSMKINGSRAEAVEVLEFLNAKAGRRYRPVDVNLKIIAARLKSGATVTECRQVIAKKCREWGSDENMSKYLRPATLFNATKFAQYQGELGDQNA